ncbi:MAG: hypothetical protein ILA03_03815 [Bacteroidaceae bacterium]|nr:hypothetical protein [Bacteroidaceae bacterium]
MRSHNLILKFLAIAFIAILVLSLACYLLESRNEDEQQLELDDTEVLNWGVKSTEYSIVNYRQRVNGYKVEAVLRWNDWGDFYQIPADLKFTKDDKSFTLHTECFGDTVYSKGRLNYMGNLDLIKENRFKTIDADYPTGHCEEGKTMLRDTPFFFKDLDFDGIDELVIVHYSMAVRYHDGFSVYRIVDGEPFLIDYPPYNTGEYKSFGMTDYPEFDFEKKTIDCPYPEGEMKWDGRTIYGVSMTKKDTIVVEGKEHYFNHLDAIEEVKFE